MNAVVLEQFFGSVRGDYLEQIGGDDDDDVDGGGDDDDDNTRIKSNFHISKLNDSCLQFWGGMGFTNDVGISRSYMFPESCTMHIHQKTLLKTINPPQPRGQSIKTTTKMSQIKHTKDR